MSIDRPNEKDAYMGVARDLLQAVEALSILSTVSPRGCALIAAHALECILKAFLWHKGQENEMRKQEVQHNLVSLWNLAYKEKDLHIPEVPPDWVTILSDGHGPNYYFRYQEGVRVGKVKTIVHGGATPELIPMTASLKSLFEIVNVAIKRKH